MTLITSVRGTLLQESRWVHKKVCLILYSVISVKKIFDKSIVKTRTNFKKVADFLFQYWNLKALLIAKLKFLFSCQNSLYSKQRIKICSLVHMRRHTPSSLTFCAQWAKDIEHIYRWNKTKRRRQCRSAGFLPYCLVLRRDAFWIAFSLMWALLQCASTIGNIVTTTLDANERNLVEQYFTTPFFL